MMMSREQLVILVCDLVNGDIDQQKGEAQILAHDAALRAQLANRCDECGAKLNLNGCLVCGAPQCCQKCCRIDYLEAQLATLTTAHQQAVEREQDTQRHLTATKAHLATVESGQAREDELQLLHDKLASWGNLDDQYHALQTQHQQAVHELGEQLRLAKRISFDVKDGNVWYWADDEYDHLESLVCPIVITPEKLREWKASLQQAVEVLAGVRNTLFQHWITAIDCNHEARTDTVRCACSVWTGTEQPCVGDAVKEWIAHVFEQAALHGTGGVTFNSRGLPSQYNKDAGISA